MLFMPTLLLKGQTIQIIKGENVPDIVCDSTEYIYKIRYTVPSINWNLIISSELGSIDIKKTVNENGEIIVTNRWNATTNSNLGKLKAKLTKINTSIETEIDVTIKSIKHLEPTITPYNPGGGVLTISPCEGGQISLEVPRLDVPGTGTFNPEKVNEYLWTLPSGWSMNGQTSNGSNEILGNYYTTITYPASAVGGSIKVRGYHNVSACSDGIQTSKSSTPITVVRDVNWVLTSSHSYFLCGDTNPITFTLTSNPSAGCAVYYWNNNPNSSTSNSFVVTPGNTDVTVTVKAVYGGKEVIKSITVPVKSFENNPPNIDGSETICTGTQDYYVDGLRTNYNLTWNSSVNIEKLTSSGNSATFRGTSSGQGWIGATINTPCGGTVPLMVKNVWVGPPITPSEIIPFWNNGMEFGNDSYYDFRVIPHPSATYYTWDVDGGTIVDGQGTNLITVKTQKVLGGNNVYFSVGVRAGSINCGVSNRIFRTGFVISGTGGATLLFSPNPATDETSLIIENYSEEEIIDENYTWNLEIYSEIQGLKLKSNNLRGKSTTIKTSGWKDGIYIVKVKTQDQILTGKLVIKR